MAAKLDITPTIAEAAGRCLARFQKCLEQSASISSQEMALVEDQLGRFSLWTASIGVFFGGRASLDHRLREAQEVHEVIIGLLETLDDQVESWSHFLESMLRPRVLETGPRSEPESIAPSRRAVSNQIALLHRLSNTIRRASTVAQNEKISTLFTIRDEEKNDVEPCLELVFTNYIRDKFRSVDNNLLQRLVSAMILRRKRILYKRARFGHKALKVLPTKTRPELTALPMNSQQKAAVSSPEIPSASPPVADDLPVKSQAGFTATTLAAEDFKKASAPSTFSAAKTVALDSHEALPFPPAPLGRVRKKHRRMKRGREEEYRLFLQSLFEKAVTESPSTINTLRNNAKADLKQDLETYWDICIDAIGEITCPFCFYAIPAREAQNEAKWKAHIKNDLDAYVCLFDECETPNQLYGHNEQWLKHMQGHALRWRCNSKSHGLLIFQTRNGYIDHMQQAHQGSFSEAQLRVLADRNARAVEPLFESCPLCGFDDTPQGGTITEHIVGHLRFLALKSFPPYHDEVSEASDVGSASSPAAKTYKRSTIDNDPDRTTILNFEDTGSISAREFLGIEINAPEEELRNNFSKGEDGLSKTYNKRSLPSLEGSSPIEEWGNFVDIPPSGVYIPIWECRDFEWGFATVDPEADKNFDDPVLQDLSHKQQQPVCVPRKASRMGRINDIDDYLGYKTRANQDDIFKKSVLTKETPQKSLAQTDTKIGMDHADISGYSTRVRDIEDDKKIVPTKETPQQLLAQTNYPRLLDPVQVDSHIPMTHQESSDTREHLRSSSEKSLEPSVLDSVLEEDSRGSSSSPLPTTEVPKGNEASMSQLKAFFKQGSRELSGASESPRSWPQPESSIRGSARPLEPILVENTPIGPILNFRPENMAESLDQSPSGRLESKPVVNDSILDDMISRLLITVRTSGGRFSRLLGLSSVPKRVCLKTAEINMICDASRELFLSQPVFLELNAPVKVVGDIHGQYTDLIRVFNLCGYPSTTNYLFLGDYVDRGKQSLETILLLLCYKLRYPQTFFLLRGNHECANVTRVYGFYDECKRRTTIKTWKTFIDVFNCMPIAAIIAKKIFCVHGGLSPALAHFDDIRNIARPTDVPDYGLLNDLLWSDPADMEEDWEPNERGVSYCFGKRVITDFLQRHDLDLVCRAHMVVEDGYEFYQDRILVTLFSAPNYCGEFDNWGGIMTVSSDLLCSFNLLPPLDAKKRGSAEDVASTNRSQDN